MPGLDPGIQERRFDVKHLALAHSLNPLGWMRGSSPRMTERQRERIAFAMGESAYFCRPSSKV
jgi:hypothetical protein